MHYAVTGWSVDISDPETVEWQNIMEFGKIWLSKPCKDIETLFVFCYESKEHV